MAKGGAVRRILLPILFGLLLVGCHLESVEGTYLAVSSTPQGAEVYIDDSLTDYRTNCVISDIEPGEYNITLKLYGFPEWSTMVKVEKNDTTKVEGIFQINEGTIKWAYTTETCIRFFRYSSAIGPDGTIYTPSNGGLVSLNPDGTLKWLNPEIEIGSSLPTVSNEGTIYIGEGRTAKIYSIAPDGSLNWEYQPDTIGRGSLNVSCIALGADGTIYFTEWDYYSTGWLYALNQGGTLKWKKEIPGWGNPSVGADGTVYVGAGDYLYAFDPNGNLKWAFQGDGEISPPAIACDGSLYFASGNYLCALSSNGTLKWRYQTNGSTYSPAIGSDGTIYFGSTAYDAEYNPYASSLFALTPSGNLKWSHSLSSDGYVSHIESTPAVGKDGTIYITHYPLGLCAFDADGNLKWNIHEVCPSSSPVVAEDGTIYVSGELKFYAIRTASFGLADSPWPCYAHDNQNTGRAGGP